MTYNITYVISKPIKLHGEAIIDWYCCHAVATMTAFPSCFFFFLKHITVYSIYKLSQATTVGKNELFSFFLILETTRDLSRPVRDGASRDDFIKKRWKSRLVGSLGGEWISKRLWNELFEKRLILFLRLPFTSQAKPSQAVARWETDEDWRRERKNPRPIHWLFRFRMVNFGRGKTP